MAVVDSYVLLADDTDPAAKKIDNVQVTTAAGDVLRQGVTLSDPTNPNARQEVSSDLPGQNAFGAAVRECAPGFDSGMVELTDSYAVVSGASIKAGGILLCNLTGVTHQAFLKDAGGKLYLNGYKLQANQTIFVPFGRAGLVGPSEWKADANAVINAQLIGEA